MAAKREYTEGTTYGEWFIAVEANSFVVKRMVYLPSGERSANRAKRSEYAKYVRAYSERELNFHATNPGETPEPPKALKDYVTRLNGKDPRIEQIKAEMNYRHSFINEDFLNQYKQDELYSSIADRSNADTVFSYLNSYGLHWFLNLKKAYTVQEWKQHEKEWGMYLMNREIDRDTFINGLRIFRDDTKERRYKPASRQLSGKVLGYTLFEMNRLIRYIYKKRRSEFEDQLVQLEPWGKTLVESYDAERRVKSPPKSTKYIKPEHWKIITDAMFDQNKIWRHEVWLAHDYGLRRRETMGLDELSVKNQHLLLTRQLDYTQFDSGRQVAFFKPLKGRESERKIPHWFSEGKITRARVRAIISNNLPHPDTISVAFHEFCKSLKDDKGQALPDYRFHDLRRTFASNAVKAGIKIDALMDATGHKSESVLRNFYLMDTRELEGELAFDDDDEEISV